MFRIRKGAQDQQDESVASTDSNPASNVGTEAHAMARQQPPQLPSRPLTSAGFPSEYGRRQLDPRVNASPSEATSNSSGPKDRCLMVGRDVKLTGKVSSCDQMSVDGYAEITLEEARLLRIGPTGHFNGQVDVSEADIGGNFEGELTVRTKLNVRATARISGVIRYGHIIVEAGAQIAGEISALDEADATDSKGASPRPTAEALKDATNRPQISRQGPAVPYQLTGQGAPIPSKS